MKKYKDDEGGMLAIDENRGNSIEGTWFIGWDYPNEGINAYLGEFSEADLTSDEDWAMRIAQEAAHPFADEDEEGYGRFVFVSKKSAQLALKAANEALLGGFKKPWPAWAIRAEAEGWAPPEGWTP